MVTEGTGIYCDGLSSSLGLAEVYQFSVNDEGAAMLVIGALEMLSKK